MAQLIEVDTLAPLPSRIRVKQGDLLLFRASGGHVTAGEGVVERLGPYTSALAGAGGEVLAPMGPPNTVLFAARQPGQATIDVVTGDPFYSAQATAIEIEVEP